MEGRKREDPIDLFTPGYRPSRDFISKISWAAHTLFIYSLHFYPQHYHLEPKLRDNFPRRAQSVRNEFWLPQILS